MPKIETLRLRACDPVAQRQFYCDVLGMQDIGDGCVGFGGEEAGICFLKADRPYVPTARDLYWKITLAVPNIELACEQLTCKGLTVSAPHQFQNVGYLAHFTDPEGFAIELIDHWFEGNRPDESVNPTLLGGGAHLNLITLRTSSIGRVQGVCKRMGMRPLCVQPISSHGFTLYFFAFTQDVPPSADLTAIENREWLYQRRYTVLEVPHVHALECVSTAEGPNAGYAGAVLSGLSGIDPSHDLLMFRNAE
ncbi:VOC family protein [Sedimentitalea todarodis]|uniref:VOC family protein n=1 Tax=Sedimentitalea todarodis TaxID=1631240 RepID=A0ABU3VLY2_9RHOB|nr:VOC family protein [Sedimentitalea todarodis]MDU9007208.1 VOC family protein [Sedimentitalea todarodis]